MEQATTSVWGSVVSGLITALVVALVSAYYQHLSGKKIEGLRSSLERQSAFFDRKLMKHEELWPLIAQCNRDQAAVTGAVQRGEDPKPLADTLSASRKKLKNFVYDNALYFDATTEKMIQDLDTKLGDRNVASVNKEVQALEEYLQKVLDTGTTCD